MPKDIAREVEKIAEDLGIDRKRSIGEVAQELKVKTHVIRFWEENFSQIRPEIGPGGRRYYYNKHLKILRRIKRFLYEEGYTIAGLKKLLSGRKHDDKEEDLRVIIEETPLAEEVDFSSERRIEIDDFIDSQVRIETGIESRKIAVQKTAEKIVPGSKIDPGSKLLDFAKLEVPVIDQGVKNKIEKHLSSAKQNLSQLKLLIGKI